MAERSDRVRAILALGAALAGTVTDVVYLRLIADQDTGSSARVTFVAAYIAAMTVLAVVGAVAIGRRRRVAEIALLTSAVGFAAIGFIGLFSIGAMLIVAAVFAAMAVRGVSDPARAGAAIAGPIVALVVGLIRT